MSSLVVSSRSARSQASACRRLAARSASPNSFLEPWSAVARTASLAAEYKALARLVYVPVDLARLFPFLALLCRRCEGRQQEGPEGAAEF